MGKKQSRIKKRAIFDIKNFYLSISFKLINEASNFEKRLTSISKTDVFIMPCLKKFGNEDFDVPMGCFDGAEVCELVGFIHFNNALQCFTERKCEIIFRL